ncbi:MAG: nickel ABC transporter permease [Acidimicrobiales bacterium]
MKRYVARRLAALAIVLWGVSLLAFVLGKLAPGDPAEIYLQRALGQQPTEEQIVAQRHTMGLDRSAIDQYRSWVAGALRGDLGRSYTNGQGVASLLGERFPRTAVLALTALGLSVSLALPVGVLAAYRRNSVYDQGSRVVALLGASLPSFFMAYLLMFVFGVHWKLFPIFGFTSAHHLVLPAVTLALGGSALLTRLTRSSLLEVLGEDYIRLAQAKGLRNRTILFRHATRNALVPILTVVSLSLGQLSAGAVIVEWIFSWPGLGTLAIDAIHQRDLPLIQGFVLFTGTIFVLINLATDLAYGWADPRIRLGAESF